MTVRREVAPLLIYESPVKTVLVLYAVGWDRLLLDPAINRLLGDLQQAGGVSGRKRFSILERSTFQWSKREM